MKKTLSLFFLLLSLLFSSSVFSFPNLERPDGGTKPIPDVDRSSESTDMAVSPDDRYIIVGDSDDLVIIDTATWDETGSQPATLDSAVEGFAFSNDSTLYAALSDGSLTRVSVTNPSDVATYLTTDSTSNFDGIAMVRSTTNNLIYLFDESSDVVYQFNISNQTIDDSFETPNNEDILDIAAIDFPANVSSGSDGGSTDVLLITTAQSKVFFVNGSTFDLITTTSLNGTNSSCTHASGDRRFTSVAIGPNRDIAFVVDNTDNTIHVVDTINHVELDAVSDQSGTNPLCIETTRNDDITSIVVTKVTEPSNAIRGFITGSSGLSVINGDRSNLEVLDMDTATSGTQPLSLSRSASHVASSSQEDGYVYVANSDGTISVISDNPFVTMSAVTPSSVTQAAPTFTLTFQTDEVCATCNYRVRVNGDVKESGTLILDNTSLSGATVNTDITTAAIDITSFASGTFTEGSNRIYVFVDDAAGNTGRDSLTLTVDLPPPNVTIHSTNFGNSKGFITITRLTEADIKQYNIYAQLASDQASPTCPGAIDFSAAPINNSVAQESSGDQITIIATNLVNGFYYCVAVEAQDNTGNVSASRVVAGPIFPEPVFGVIGGAGEVGGCSLNHHADGHHSFILLLALLVTLLLSLRARRAWQSSILSLFLLFLFFSQPAHAVELTEEHWAGEVKGGFYFPTNDNMDRFFGGCCNGFYEFRFGRLIKSQLQIDVGLGFMLEKASALGSITNRPSGERFTFMILPISNSVTYRFDRLENQVLVPFVGAGVDYMWYRESLSGSSTSGWKFGYHAFGGLQILLEWFDRVTDFMEGEGVNDVYLTLEGRWTQIDNFGGNGLNVSGFSTMMGLYFSF